MYAELRCYFAGRRAQGCTGSSYLCDKRKRLFELAEAAQWGEVREILRRTEARSRSKAIEGAGAVADRRARGSPRARGSGWRTRARQNARRLRGRPEAQPPPTRGVQAIDGSRNVVHRFESQIAAVKWLAARDADPLKI